MKSHVKGSTVGIYNQGPRPGKDSKASSSRWTAPTAAKEEAAAGSSASAAPQPASGQPRLGTTSGPTETKSGQDYGGRQLAAGTGTSSASKQPPPPASATLDSTRLDAGTYEREFPARSGPLRTSISEFARRTSLHLALDRQSSSLRSSETGSVSSLAGGRYTDSVLATVGFSGDQKMAELEAQLAELEANRRSETGAADLQRAASSITQGFLNSISPPLGATAAQAVSGLALPLPGASDLTSPRNPTVHAVRVGPGGAPLPKHVASPRRSHTPRVSNTPRGAVHATPRTLGEMLSTFGANKNATILVPHAHARSRRSTADADTQRSQQTSPAAGRGSELFQALRAHSDEAEPDQLSGLLAEDKEDFMQRQRALAKQMQDAKTLDRLQRRMGPSVGSEVDAPLLSARGSEKGPAQSPGRLKGALKHPGSWQSAEHAVEASTPTVDGTGNAVAVITAGDTPLLDTPSHAAAETVYEASPEAELMRMNIFRRSIARLATNPNFEALTILLICCNIVSLAMYRPLEPDSQWNRSLATADLSMNAFFTTELVMRMITASSVKGYLRVPWNVFDLLMVLAGWTALLPTSVTGNKTQVVRALRAIRALRPLRTITRVESLRSVVVCFLEAVPMLMSVVGLLVFTIFMFAIAGMMLFNDAYHHACVNNATGQLEDTPSNNSDEWGCGYRKCPANYTCTAFEDGTQLDSAGFDNVAASCLEVFQVITQAAWSYQMYRMMDATNPAACIYFILILIVGAYLVVNLFLAVLIDKFGKAQTLFKSAVKTSRPKRQNILSSMIAAGRSRINSYAALRHTRSQAEWMKRTTTMESLSRQRSDLIHSKSFGLQSVELPSGTTTPTGMASNAQLAADDLDIGAWEMRLFSARWHVRQLVERSSFSNIFLLCTVINTVFLAIAYDGQSDTYTDVLQYANLAFTCCFTVELALKLFALGIMEYLSDNFNIFDLIVVPVSWVDLLLEMFAGSSTRQLSGLRVLRALRVLRLFKLFKYLPSLRRISEVLLATVSSFAAIAALSALFVVVYAIIGLHVYGGIEPSGPAAGSGDHPFPNFDNFFNAFFLIFQALTMENWEQNMYGYMDATNSGAAIFFVSWILIGAYTFLELFLAVVLEGFQSKYDPQATTEAYLAYKSIKKKLGTLKKMASRSISRRMSWMIPDHVTLPDDIPASFAIPALHSHTTHTQADADAHERSGPTAGRLELEVGPMQPHGTAHDPVEAADAGSRSSFRPVDLPRLPQPVAEGLELSSMGPGHLRGPLCHYGHNRQAEDMPGVGAVSDELRSLDQWEPEAALEQRRWSHYAASTSSCAAYPQPIVTAADQQTEPGAHTVAALRPLRYMEALQPGPVAEADKEPRDAATEKPPMRARTFRKQKSSVSFADVQDVLGGTAGSFASPLEQITSSPRGDVAAQRYMPVEGDALPEQGYRPRVPASPHAPVSSRHRMAVETTPLSLDAVSRLQQSFRTGAAGSQAGVHDTAEGSPPAPSPQGQGMPASGMSPMERFMQHKSRKALFSAQQAENAPDYDTPADVLPISVQPPGGGHAISGKSDRMGSLRAFAAEMQGKKVPEDVPQALIDVEASRYSMDLPREVLTSKAANKALKEAEAAKALLQHSESRREAPHDNDDTLSIDSDNSRASRSTTASVAMHKGIPLHGTACFFLKADNPIRIWLYRLVSRRSFDMFMFIFIFISCIAMMLERPSLSDDSQLAQALKYIDAAVTTVFAVEAFLKTLAFGFRGYLSTATNRVDFLIVVTSVLLLVLEAATASAAGHAHFLQGLRVLRVLKPLRMLTRSRGMLLVFKSLTLSMASLTNVGIVCALFFLIFAILGVQLFGGLFWACNDASVDGKVQCYGTFVDPGSGTTLDREWKRAPIHFDNVLSALYALTICASLNGFTPIVVNAMAAPSAKDLQPRPLRDPAAFLYFLVFLVICTFCLLNLFVGVVFYQFSRIRLMSETGSAFLTTKQQEWSMLAKMVFRLRPLERIAMPHGKAQMRMYKVATSKALDRFIMVVILANVVVLAAYWYGEPAGWTRAKEACNSAFTCIFVIEAAVKIYGLTWRIYIANAWNKFDLFLVISSCVDMLLTYMASGVPGLQKVLKIQKVLRLLRLTRMLRLIKSFKGLRALLQTLVLSVPAFWNVGSLLALLIFMYSYVGVQLFAKLEHHAGINAHSNFEDFGNAALTMWRMSTTDDWALLIQDMVRKPPNCSKAQGTCGTPLAYPFCLSFFLLAAIIILNLFTAVIIENYEKQQEQAVWSLTPASLQEFQELWRIYDDGSGTIEPPQLEQLILRLSPPLGLGPQATARDVLRFVYDLDIPLVHGRVPFHRTLYELVRRCSETAIPEGEIKDQIERMLRKFFAHLQLDEELNFSTAVIVMRAQRRWRAKARAARIRRVHAMRRERAELPPMQTVLGGHERLARELQALKRQGQSIWKLHPTYAEVLPSWRTEGVNALTTRWRQIRNKVKWPTNQVLPMPAADGSTRPMLRRFGSVGSLPVGLSDGDLRAALQQGSDDRVPLGWGRHSGSIAGSITRSISSHIVRGISGKLKRSRSRSAADAGSSLGAVGGVGGSLGSGFAGPQPSMASMPGGVQRSPSSSAQAWLQRFHSQTLGQLQRWDGLDDQSSTHAEVPPPHRLGSLASDSSGEGIPLMGAAPLASQRSGW